MKSGLLSCAVVSSFVFLAGYPASAFGQVVLTSAAPSAAEPGLTTIRVVGSGFPSGTINPANIQVQLTPQGGGSSTVVTATQCQTVAGTIKRVAFLVPASISATSPTVFLASISDTVDGFSSSNTASFTADPLASIASVGPNSGTQGQSVSVTITGNYSNFLSGVTQVSAGAQITVGTVTVASPTSVTAQFQIASNASTGLRTVTVTTGSEIASLSNSFTVKQATVSVPNVVGDTQSAASTALTSSGLVVGTVTTQASSTVAAGNVISENPTAGTSVNAGSSVNLVVSSGPAKVSVPNVVGDTQSAASTAITTAGLVVGTITTQASGTVASGNVISENPTAGTSVNTGSSVNLVVSSGPAQVSVPNVVGDTQSAASTAITTAGLVVGTITTQASGTVASGNVISENPTAGTSVNTGSSVNLVVSSGPAQVSVPNVVGDTQSAASTAITTAGLVVGTVTTQASSTVASGNVISENPTAGTSVNTGSSVNLVVSSGPAKVSVPNVVGDTQSAASTAITTAGLVEGTVTTQASGTVASGNVISESPTAGTSVNTGSSVNLVVSSGLAKVSVPNVVGDTQSAASTAITTAGLVVGTITTQASGTVASGNVISENPTAGTSVNAGSSVNLVVSSGPAKVSVPNVVGDTQSAASTAITTAGLVVGTITTQASGTVASGNVISENPTAGTSVNAGSSVNLVVSSGPAKVSVPNVVGDTQSAASTAITTAGLVVGTVTTQASSTVAAGNVISENPTAGTSVNTGSSVNLVVSSGLAKVSVPNVVGDTQSAASTAITTAGLVVGTITTQASGTVASGNVISENPTAGTSVNAGSSVNLVVSSGPAKVSVPNVVGDTQSAASTAITTAGLVVGTITTQASGTVASGNVISENPTAGTSVNAGSSVNLVVSSGPAKVSVPNVVGDTQSAASTAITTAGLVVGTVTTQASSTVAAGNVISENPTAGTSVNTGSSVNLVVSSGLAKVSVPNVVGDTQSAASTAITTAGLVVGTVTTQASSTVASGNVISENPTAGTSVNTGSSVNLVVSSGPAKVSVPNVVGDTQAVASTALTSAGLVVGTITTQASGTVASGNVISENPTAGTSVNAGSSVNLVVSSGPAKVSVPNVVGDTQAVASTALTSAGLVVGTVTTQASGTVASGNVISENPTAGTQVAGGSSVSLVISSGPATTGPASVQVNLSAQVVPWAGSVTVTPVALDGSGNVINDPALQFTIKITAVGTTVGNAPVLSGNTITFPKLNKKLLNQNPTLDPNGVYADTDPTDPNYGKQTGGVYLVTASLNGSNLSGSTQVICLPTGTASVTAQTYDYALQLNGALNQILTAYNNTNHSGFTNAKAALQAVLSNSGFNTSVLSANQVAAPADGGVITPDLLGSFPTSPDDPAYSTALTNVISAVQAATAQVNAITTSSPTQAQVLTIQAALTTYKGALATLNALKPSAVEIATVNDQLNELLSTDIPTLLDAITSQISAVASPLSGRLIDKREAPFVLARALSRMHMAPQFFDIFAGLFGACVDLESQALNNIITLTVALVNDVINLEAAKIINSRSPAGMSIDLVIASASLSFACPNYPNTEVDAFGLDSNPANDVTLVVGAVNGGILGSIGSFSVPSGIGQVMSLLATIYQTGRDIGQALNINVLLTPDQFIAGGGIFSDGSDALIFNNGWPQVNQSPIPAVGLVVVTNKKAGGFAATNIDILGSCN